MTLDFRHHVEAWLKKAENDLLSAQRLIEIEPMILDTACFHCQQAVEKSLKAFLIYKGQDVAKTHDVDFLLNECARFDPVFSKVDTININDFAVLIRYPDAAFLPEPSEAKQYYELAVRVNQLTLLHGSCLWSR